MDDFSRYHQLKMYLEDKKHISFRTPLGMNNTEVTYQWAMNTIFHEHTRKTVECYINDIAVKSRNRSDHIADLKRVFDIMPAHQLKMNPTKSFLRVASEKFFRFVVTSKEIHLDPEKVHAIQGCNLQEL